MSNIQPQFLIDSSRLKDLIQQEIISKNEKSATGILVGRKENFGDQEKWFIVDVFLTPNPVKV